MSATQTKLTRAESARLNGAKGKGPVSKEGKEKSSQNALKHGLSAGKWLSLPDDEEGAYEEFFDWMYEDLAPEGAEQIFYATRMIECMWRLRRIPILEAKLIEPKPYQKCPTGLDLKGGWLNCVNDIARYEASLERTLERNRKALKNLQKEPNSSGAPSRDSDVCAEAWEGVGGGPHGVQSLASALEPGGAGTTKQDQIPQNEPKPHESERTANSLSEQRELDLALFYLEDHPELTLEEARKAVSPHLPHRH